MNESRSNTSSVIIDLSAVLATASEDQASILLIKPDSEEQSSHHRLPSGPFNPEEDRTLEEAVRRWVLDQTGMNLEFVEQLYTFGDRFRDPDERDGAPRPISIGYIALVQQQVSEIKSGLKWLNWYAFFPWEDWRNGAPEILDTILKPKLMRWVNESINNRLLEIRRDRVEAAFGFGNLGWDADRVLERYELLYEAGLVEESLTDRNNQSSVKEINFFDQTGLSMYLDHRRILATALGRLRGKIRYRPVVFEFMPDSFTLFQLQKVVEAIAGERLHKQNFRRLVASEGLVEPTQKYTQKTGGRPAKLFRFRPEVLTERSSPGVRVLRRRSTVNR